MDRDAHPRTAFTWEPDGKRKRGRARETEKDNTERVVKERAQIVEVVSGRSSGPGTLEETVLSAQFSRKWDLNQMKTSFM